MLAYDDVAKKTISTTQGISDEFDKLADAAETEKGKFFKQLIDHWKATGVPSVLDKTKEIQDLDRHIVRIKEIYLSLIGESADRKEEFERKLALVETEYQLRLKDKDDELEQKDSSLKGVTELYEDQLKDNEKLVNDIAEVKKTLVLTERVVGNLETEKTGLERRIADLEPLAEANKELQRINGALEKDVKGLAEKKAELIKEAENREKEHGRQIEALNSQFGTKIELLKLEHEKAVLELRKQFADELAKLKEANDAVVDGLKNRIHDLESEKNGLLEEILKLKTGE